MNEIVDEVLETVAPLREKYVEFNQPRSDVQLRAFVVSQHDTPMRQLHQCLLEISIKDRAIRRTQINLRQMMSRLVRMNGDERELLEIDIEETEEALLGAVRELRTLIAIYESFEVEFTHEAWMAEEAEYWRQRLIRQARQEINYCGSIGVGNQQSLEQIGVDPARLIQEHRCKTLPEFLSSSGTSALQSQDMPPAGLLTLQNSNTASG